MINRDKTLLGFLSSERRLTSPHNPDSTGPFWCPRLLFTGLLIFGAVSLDLGSAIADSITTRGLPTLSTTDVSPNATFGSTSTGEDPSGRIMSLAIDPSNNSILYAASQMAGVWKSVDGGRNWKQASAGLRAGNTQNNYSLAVDFVNPQHLLYAAMDDDGRNAISCPENVVEVECT